MLKLPRNSSSNPTKKNKTTFVKTFQSIKETVPSMTMNIGNSSTLPNREEVPKFYGLPQVHKA